MCGAVGDAVPLPDHASPKPGGLNSRPLASSLSCQGELCFFSCGSCEFNKAEAQIPISPLFSCQLPSQLLPHWSNGALATSTYSSVCSTPFLERHLDCRAALWPQTPASSGSEHKLHGCQSISSYIGCGFSP